MTDAPPRPLDDLTRDLRARTYRGLNAIRVAEERHDPLPLEAADEIDRLRAALDGANTIIADAKIDHLTHPDPKSFAHDAYAELVMFEDLEDDCKVARYRRQLSLDGGKYKIVLAETIISEGRFARRLNARFLRHGTPWPAGDEAYRHANVVSHLAEALWERAYAAKSEPPSLIDESWIGDRLAHFAKTLPPHGAIYDIVNDAQRALTAMRARDVAFSLEIEELREEKQGDATKTIKSALDALRPILKHHFVRDYVAPGGNVDCACGVRVRTVSDHVDHVLELLAFGAEPPKDYLLRAFEEDDIVRPTKNAHALPAVDLRCDKCGATGTLGDYCRCDPEESLPRDGTRIVGVESHLWPSLRGGLAVLSIAKAVTPSRWRVTARGGSGEAFWFLVDDQGRAISGAADYDVVNFAPTDTIAFYDVDYAIDLHRSIYEAAVGPRLAAKIVDGPRTLEDAASAAHYAEHIRKLLEPTPKPPSLADLRARADGIAATWSGTVKNPPILSGAVYEALKWAAGWR